MKKGENLFLLVINLFRYIALFFLLMLAKAWSNVFGEDSLYLQLIYELLIATVGIGVIIWIGRRIDGLYIPINKSKFGVWIGIIIPLLIILSASVIDFIISENASIVFDTTQWKSCLFVGFFWRNRSFRRAFL